MNSFESFYSDPKLHFRLSQTEVVQHEVGPCESVLRLALTRDRRGNKPYKTPGDFRLQRFNRQRRPQAIAGQAPNEVVPVEIEILPSSTLFLEGVSLQLVIQGADLFEHPSLAHEWSAEVNLGTHSIHSGAQYDSHLLIPVIP